MPWVAFTKNGWRSDQFGNQIWLMGPDGEKKHPLFERDEHSRYEAIRWSPNGRRLTYVFTESMVITSPRRFTPLICRAVRR